MLTRWRAAGVHLAGSMLVIGAFLSLLWFVWFPGALLDAAGGMEGMRIVVLVDLVLGPLLTLIVFNPVKTVRELSRDIGTIVLLQCICLVAGGYIVWQARPLAVVHVFDTFYSLNEQDLLQAGVGADSISTIRDIGPSIFYVPVAETKEGFISKHVSMLLNGEQPLQYRVDLFQPVLPDGSADVVEAITRFAKNDPSEDCVWLDFESSYKSGRVCYGVHDRSFASFVSQ